MNEQSDSTAPATESIVETEPLTDAGPHAPHAIEPSTPAEVEPAPPEHAAVPVPRIRRTRVSTAWAALSGGALILILVLIFVLENLTPGKFAFLGAHFTLPLGIAVLLAAIVGVLVMAVIGTARIRQVRRAMTRRK